MFRLGIFVLIACTSLVACEDLAPSARGQLLVRGDDARFFEPKVSSADAKILPKPFQQLWGRTLRSPSYQDMMSRSLRSYNDMFSRSLRSGVPYDEMMSRVLRSNNFSPYEMMSRSLRSRNLADMMSRTLRSRNFNDMMSRTLRSGYEDMFSRSLRSSPHYSDMMSRALRSESDEQLEEDSNEAPLEA